MKKEKIEDAKTACVNADTCIHVGDDCSDEGGKGREYACFGENEPASNEGAKPEEGVTDTNENAVEPVPFVCGETSGPFKSLLPVPLSDGELAGHGIEMARIHALWIDIKLKAKAYAKSCKELVDRYEAQELEIAEIVNAKAEEREVDVYWAYDHAHGLKRLYRCDTGEVVSESAMELLDYQNSPTAQAAASEKNVLAMTQEGAQGEAGAAESGEPVEGQDTIEGDVGVAAPESLFDGPDDKWPEPPGK